MCRKCRGRMRFVTRQGCVCDDTIKLRCSMLIQHSRKISLGMKQTAPNPWDIIEDKYPEGTEIEGKVKVSPILAPLSV